MDKTKIVSIRDVPVDLWKAVRLEAMKRGLTTQAYVISVLQQAVDSSK